MPNVSIVSGTYRRLDSLKTMVDSVRSSVGRLTYEIILVGVKGDTPTIEWAQTQPDIRWIEQPGLMGAIAAFNEGAAAAKGDYVIFSNDDLTFLGDAITRAYTFMLGNPDVGIGCFYTDRSNQSFHVAIMPAHYADGSPAQVYYGGIVIAPRWLGNALKWWELRGARTYGGDNAFCARAIEAGWRVEPVEGAKIHEGIVEDELKALNNNVPRDNNHPDTQAYLTLFPHGPELGRTKTVYPDRIIEHPKRWIYAPIYERGHREQHEQKCGMRRALQRIGLVQEIDYAHHGVHSIIGLARQWNPDYILTQFHDADEFTPSHAARLRAAAPNAKLVNWNGDVYDRSDRENYIAMLRHFDIHGVVNASSIPNYVSQGVHAVYWQIGYEADGVGHEPDKKTPRHDVVFLGNGYSEDRQGFGEFLSSLPYDVGIYGSGWKVASKGETLYDFRTGCKIYRAAKIALGDSQWPISARGFVSNRLFQVMAAGGAMLLHQWFDGMEDLLSLRDGVHLVTWKTHDELEDKISYYLAHESERRKIATAGHREVLRNHSFEKRVAQLMNILHAPPGTDDPVLAVAHEVHHA